jgi:tetratricopeptide (TPR) repeat protein
MLMTKALLAAASLTALRYEMSTSTTELNRQAKSLKGARSHKGWSQSRLAAALEQAARALGHSNDLPTGGRKTLTQYISYFENGKRAVPDRLKPIFCEAFKATAQDLGFDAPRPGHSNTELPSLPTAHLRSSGPIVLSSLQSILGTTIQADAQIGPAYLIPGIEGQIPVIEKICQMTRGADHDQALRLASQFTEFCGWLYQDSGDYECAMSWTDHSLEYAIELDDRRVISYVLMRKSNVSTDSGRPGHGLGLANAALKQRDQLTPRLRAVALRQRANAFAMLNEPSEFARDYEDALKQARAGMSQEEHDLAPYCTPSFVEMEAGSSWVRLNVADSAISVFEASRTHRDAVEQVRDHALCLARLATVYATLGEPDRACLVAEDLIDTANGLGSARVARQVSALHASLAPWRSRPVVTDLLHRLETFRVPLSLS